MFRIAQEIIPVNIEDELKQSYLDYAMSVIIGRALPDVRDGLKPVHRRILFSMQKLGNDWNKPYKKSARIVGDVIGKYHPHGDAAVYDAIVRMAQSFSMRYVLINGQGNFGSVDGDLAAAMRYTEIKMSKLAHELLSDLDKNTVDFIPNYDETESIPVVFPTKIPNLLINGSSGIAVGMATNIPPHNLSEVLNACIALIDNPKLSIEDIIQFIPGPDFPTSAIINGNMGIYDAYRTGRGKISIRAKVKIETNSSGHKLIIVKELPYQVNKAKLIEKIAYLVKDKRIEGISNLRDESDKQGIRIVIELKKGESEEIILNNLYNYTQMQNSFYINMVALVNGRPCVLNLKEILEHFINHRREVTIRRIIFDLKNAEYRAHILEGINIAILNIDEIINIMKTSNSIKEAKEILINKVWKLNFYTNNTSKKYIIINNKVKKSEYKFSFDQVQSILDFKLNKLIKIETNKIIEEYNILSKYIKDLSDILNSSDKLMKIIRKELIDIKTKFGDSRNTKIVSCKKTLSLEDLITEQDIIITLSYHGYVKYQPISEYHTQRRGGKGKLATNVKEEDFVERLIIAKTHDNLLCFSNFGKIYWIKAYKLPLASRISRGKPIVNILSLSSKEKINAILPIRTYKKEYFIIMATKRGIVKKISLKSFKTQRSSGVISINLQKDDQLVGVDITDGNKEIMLFTDSGKVVRFHESAVRMMGRNAKGIIGIRLKNNQCVISLIVVKNIGTILTVTKMGYGKKTMIGKYPISNRGIHGVMSMRISHNEKVVKAIQVQDNEDVILITDKGKLVRFQSSELSIIGRYTKGVKLINLSQGEYVVGMQKIKTYI